MTRVLNEFEEKKNIFASKINENFTNLQLDIGDVSSSVTSISSTVTSLQSTVNTITGELSSAGTIVWFTKTTAPTGYLICNGSAVSRTDYSELFGVIGTTYGAGDESTTFNLPDLIGKVAYGSSTLGSGYATTGAESTGHTHWFGNVVGGTQGWNTSSESTTHTHSLSSCNLLPCIKY